MKMNVKTDKPSSQILVRLPDAEHYLFRRVADLKGTTVNDMLRLYIREQIADLAVQEYASRNGQAANG